MQKKPEETKPAETNGRKLQMLTWHADGYGLVNIREGKLAAVYGIRKHEGVYLWTKVRMKGDGISVGIQHTVILGGRPTCTCEDGSNGEACSHIKATLALRQSGKI